MSSDDLFVAEEGVIAAAERLLADGVFDSPDEQKNFEQLLKSYQKLFRTARRLMRLGDHNERQLNAAAEVIAQKNKELESLSTKLSKYLSPQIYNSISEDLTNLLNRYLTEMSTIALEYGATIDKYIGDAIMVFFGDPETKGLKDDALACVRMAIAMVRRMRELRSEWQELGAEKPFRLRIGINTGYVTVGNFGSNDRMDYTIIGNAVNLTARLQSHAEIDGILLGHETYSLVKDEVAAEEQTPIKVKGFAEPVRCYKVQGLYDHLAEEGTVIREEQEGFKFHLNLQKRDKEDAIRILEGILLRLKR
jgi:adenylate cyclase